jgi:hypothetical protein
MEQISHRFTSWAASIDCSPYTSSQLPPQHPSPRHLPPSTAHKQETATTQTTTRQLMCRSEGDFEYKYVVRNEHDHTAASWKPGENFKLKLPEAGKGTVRVRDAWDETFREVQIEVVSLQPAKRGRKKKVSSMWVMCVWVDIFFGRIWERRGCGMGQHVWCNFLSHPFPPCLPSGG